MDTRLFPVYMVMLSAMRLGPDTYRNLMCVEPTPGYVQQFMQHVSASDIPAVCPSSVDLAWRVGNEVFVTLLAILLTLLLWAVPSVAMDALSRIQAWRLLIDGSALRSLQSRVPVSSADQGLCVYWLKGNNSNIIYILTSRIGEEYPDVIMTQYVINDITTFHGDVSFTGIPYEAFDRTGHWSLWGVMKMFEAARLMGLYNNLFDFRSIDGKYRGLVAIKQAVRLCAELHRDHSIFNTLKQRYELDIVEVGRRSFSFVTRLTNEETGKLLGEVLLKYVLIDRRTRKSVPLPESFLEKYAKHLKKNLNINELSIPECPNISKDVFQLKVLPLHSDTDRNNHVNQSVYFRFCMDCATDAALSGRYRHFTSDMCWYPVLELNVYHVNESHANNELIVNTWQDNDDFRLIYFIIKRKETVIFKASILFYPEQSKRKRNSRM